MGGAKLPRSLQESLDNTKVSYAQLGKSGLRVSVPILGTMSFGKLCYIYLRHASESHLSCTLRSGSSLQHCSYTVLHYSISPSLNRRTPDACSI